MNNPPVALPYISIVVTGRELADLYRKRAALFSERAVLASEEATAYAARAKDQDALVERGFGPAPLAGLRPGQDRDAAIAAYRERVASDVALRLAGIHAQAEEFRRSAAALAFMADHLEPDEDYRVADMTIDRLLGPISGTPPWPLGVP